MDGTILFQISGEIQLKPGRQHCVENKNGNSNQHIFERRLYSKFTKVIYRKHIFQCGTAKNSTQLLKTKLAKGKNYKDNSQVEELMNDTLPDNQIVFAKTWSQLM